MGIRISCSDVRAFDCPACTATVGEECLGVRAGDRPWEHAGCHRERWQLGVANREILTIDSDGNVANSRGDVVARVIELTIDMSAARLTGGGGHGQAVNADPSKRDSGTERNPRASLRTSASNDSVTRIWAHYQSVIPGASRQALDPTRTSIIRNALKVRDEATVIAAIDGLARSPHHNGQNDRAKKYLGIRYALAGIGKESVDERVDKMAGIAAPGTADLLAGIPSAVLVIVRTRQKLVEDTLLNPGDVNMAARAGESVKYLREAWGLYAVEVAPGRIEWRRELGDGHGS